MICDRSRPSSRMRALASWSIRSAGPGAAAATVAKARPAIAVLSMKSLVTWRRTGHVSRSRRIDITSLTRTYAYHPQVLEELARHGLRPLPTTSPQQLRDAVRDLYKHEIKRLRADLLANRVRKT